jgi:glycosyltransferase involved in cell wall biosynthesis
MIKWLKKRSVPTILDVKDLWPEIFVEPFPMLFKPLIRLLLAPYYLMANKAINDSSVLCSMSESFLARILKLSKRVKCDLDMVVPLTAPKDEVDKNLIETAIEWWAERGITSENRSRVCFIGSLSRAFDFSCVRSAAERIKAEGIDCQFVLCGEGQEADAIKNMMKGLDNVIFPGWIDAPKISYLVCCSIASLAPYKNIDNFLLNMPNKIIDALSYGLPIITTLSGEVGNLVEKEGVGIVCNEERGTSVYDAIKYILWSQDEAKKMSNRAKDLYINRFSHDKVYGLLVDKMEEIVRS